MVRGGQLWQSTRWTWQAKRLPCPSFGIGTSSQIQRGRPVDLAALVLPNRNQPTVNASRETERVARSWAG